MASQDHLEATLLAMLDNPEQAEAIFDWTMSEDADDFFSENEIPESSNYDSAKARGVQELLNLHASIWDLPTDQIPEEEDILAQMGNMNPQEKPDTPLS